MAVTRIIKIEFYKYTQSYIIELIIGKKRM